MACTPTLPDLDLNIFDMRDSTTIAIVDVSTYVAIPISSQVALQVTPPGYPTINIPFTPGTVNVYKCVDLGITCNDSGCTSLPDGIYNIIYTIVPNINIISPGVNTTVDLKFIKIDQIKCLYQHAFLRIDLQCCPTEEIKKYKHQLREIKLLVDGSVANCAEGNYRLSFELYSKAEQLLNTISCRFNWNCCNFATSATTFCGSCS